MIIPAHITKLAEIIKANGGRAMLVGGCVRDELMGLEPKDWDVEVYGVEPKKLKEILSSLGRVDAVGESFTVYKLGQDLDVSLPRRERKVARGHKGFVVEGDPEMSFAEASNRRDFTINAILKDILTGEIIDVYGGRGDIEKRVLRHVSKETFAEDSLRVLRAAQFAARFEFGIDAETVALCRSIDVSDLPKERIWGEMEKLLLKAENPSIGLRWLYDLGVVRQLFPEMEALVGVPQESEWHPEGWLFSALPSESFVTGVAEALGIDRTSLTLGEFLTSSSADPTVIPTGGGTGNAEPFVTGLSDLKPADGAGPDSSFSPSSAGPTVLAETQSLVWLFGTPAPLTDEIVRIMFKISLDKMGPIVLPAVDDLEIVRGIVLPVAVFVMNMLTGFEFPSQNDLHNNSMDSGGSVFPFATGVNIPVIVMDARTSAVDDDVFVYFDLSFVGDRDFVHRGSDSFSSNCFEVELGDVWYHTRLVVDEARKLIDDLPYPKKVAVMLGALCHDFGKPATTRFFDGRWRSHAHDEAGVEPTLTFLDKLNIHTIGGFDVREQVVQLVRYHLKPGMFYKVRDEIGDGAFRRLAQRVEPDLLYRVARADSLGRNPDWLPEEKRFKAEAQEWFIERVHQLKVEEKAPEPILLGRHLIELGLKPSPQFGKILKAVYELQLDGRITDLDEAIEKGRELIKEGV
ncbi:MAG: HD domain-containing protein [Pyrinomonadaceae bacterium]